MKCYAAVRVHDNTNASEQQNRVFIDDLAGVFSRLDELGMEGIVLCGSFPKRETTVAFGFEARGRKAAARQAFNIIVSFIEEIGQAAAMSVFIKEVKVHKVKEHKAWPIEKYSRMARQGLRGV